MLQKTRVEGGAGMNFGTYGYIRGCAGERRRQLQPDSVAKRCRMDAERLQNGCRMLQQVALPEAKVRNSAGKRGFATQRPENTGQVRRVAKPRREERRKPDPGAGAG